MLSFVSLSQLSFDVLFDVDSVGHLTVDLNDVLFFSFDVLFDVENVAGLASDLDDVLFFSKFITSFVEALESC